MDISVANLIYSDPPVTKGDLLRAQQMISPVNFPTCVDKIEISDNAKALALKLAGNVTKDIPVNQANPKE